MTDYIEREAALKALCADCCAKECDKELCQDYHNISVLPAADVRPVVKGHWISHDFVDMSKGRYTGSVECSACGRFLPMKEYFCPNCGADMKGEADGD